MLKGIPHLLSPELLHVLASMGHGDEIVLADANFPATTHAKRLIHAPGATVPALLDAVLTLMPLDTFVAQAALTMQVVDAPDSVPETVAECNRVLARHNERASSALERFAFYERATSAFAIVATGELRIYGNIILKKGVIAP